MQSSTPRAPVPTVPPAGDPTVEAPLPLTGVVEVDRVISSLDELDAREPKDHVAIYEQADLRLREALDAPTDIDQMGGV